MIRRILLVMVGVALFTGLVAYSEGAVMVYVHEKKPEGHRIWVPVPALLVDLGVRFVPEERLQDALRDLRPWLPAIEAASHELKRCPDGLLVEVHPNPEQALSDGAQSLYPAQFGQMMRDVRLIAEAIGRRVAEPAGARA